MKPLKAIVPCLLIAITAIIALPAVGRTSAMATDAVAVESKSQDRQLALWYESPARGWGEAIPVGNGRLGAMVFGAVDEERIVLNESSVWSGSINDDNRKDAYKALPEIRRLLAEGKNPEAADLVMKNFTCQGAGSGNGSGANVPFGCYQVLGNLHLKFGGSALQCVSGHRTWSSNQEIEASTDGNVETKWCVVHEGKPVVWQMDAGQSDLRPTTYRLTSAEDVPAHDPRTWKLEGSLDGKTWKTLDEHKDEPEFEKRHETKSYTIAQPAAVRYFRFTFMPNPGVTHFQVADISIEGVTPRAAALEAYSRKLELSTAEATVNYKKDGVTFTREHFVSAPDEVFVTRLTGPLSFTVALDRPERFETKAVNDRELLMTGTLNDGRGGKGVSYAGRLRVIARGGVVKADGNQLVVERAEEAILLFAAATDFRGFAGRQLSDPVGATASDLDSAGKKSFDELRAAQKADHEKWFNRVVLSLPATENSAQPTGQRLAGFARAQRTRAGRVLLQLWPVPADQFVAAGRPAGKSARHLG